MYCVVVQSAGVPAGCLRRPLVTPHVCWIPAGKVDVESGTEDSSASLADLMRCVWIGVLLRGYHYCYIAFRVVCSFLLLCVFFM